jgi:hypothetical protein
METLGMSQGAGSEGRGTKNDKAGFQDHPENRLWQKAGR